MYSPGQWHTHVPRERKANLAFRCYVLRRCKGDVRFRRAVLHMCRDDIVFFINTFVWQFNPNAFDKNFTKLGPFITQEYQDVALATLLKVIEFRSDCIIEKSRDMGASWLCLIVMVWFFVFHPMSKFLCVSRNEKAVDDADDADSLFWKIDYMLSKLPEWIVDPADYSRKKMSFRNRVNGSQITGQATTSKMGIGGRCLAMFVDEFSQIDEAREVYNRTSDTTSCRIFNGTHTGPHTQFHDLTIKASPNLVKLVMHWTMHPDKCKGLYEWDRFAQRTRVLDPDYVYPPDFPFVKDGSPTGGPRPGVRSPWYDAQCHRKGSLRAVAADLDINPVGTSEEVFPALMIRDLVTRYCVPPTHTCELEWIKAEAVPVRLHDRSDGLIKLWQPLPPDGLPPPGYYVFGADVATGTGASPSCLCGANAETGEKVLEYSNHAIDPKDFAYLCVAICRLFKGPEGELPKFAWEIPGPGNTVTKHVLLLGYHNIFCRTSSEYRIKREVTDTPGWNNTNETMKALIEDYKDALRNRDFLNRSASSLTECTAFNYASDGYVYHSGWKDPRDNSGARINHGDHVVADALCWKLVHESRKLVQIDPETHQRLIAPAKISGTLAWRKELDRLRRRDEGTWA
jgi:hypothetical protein